MRQLLTDGDDETRRIFWTWINELNLDQMQLPRPAWLRN